MHFSTSIHSLILVVSLVSSTRRVLNRIDLTLASFPLLADEHVRTRPNRKQEEEEVHRDRQPVVVECRSFPIIAFSTRLVKVIRYDTGYHNALLFVSVYLQSSSSGGLSRFSVGQPPLWTRSRTRTQTLRHTGREKPPPSLPIKKKPPKNQRSRL